MDNEKILTEKSAMLDSSILSFIIFRLLPDSKKGIFTPLKALMASSYLVHYKILEKDVIRLLTESPCSYLFSGQIIGFKEKNRSGWVKDAKKGDELEFCIDYDWFFTVDERASSL